MRSLRARIGLASPSLGDQLRRELTPVEIVMSARYAALEPWWHTYDQADRDRARSMLDRMGCAALADRPFGVLSSGERQRVLLARTLMTEPGLVLLDEPTAGLDLGGREELVATLADLARDRATPPTVLVTHHLEEIPPGFTHALLVTAGRVVGCGPLDDVLRADTLSACFGLNLVVERSDGRWSAARPLSRANTR